MLLFRLLVGPALRQPADGVGNHFFQTASCAVRAQKYAMLGICRAERYHITAMMIPTLLAMRDFSRLREIIAILTKHGLGEFVQRIKLSGKTPSENPDADSRYIPTPRRFRLAFEELGPTFVKLGQILSTRVDIFNAEWIEEFEQLQCNVAPIATEDIGALI